MDILTRTIEHYDDNGDGYKWRNARGFMFVKDDYEEQRGYYGRLKPNEGMKQLRRLVKKLLNDKRIFSNEELQKDDSIFFAIIIDACGLAMGNRDRYSSYGETEWMEEIYQRYRDEILRLAQDKKLVKPLLNSYKTKLRTLKQKLDPKNNLNYVEFKNYQNPLSMIAFMNGHISGEKLSQANAKKILAKMIFKDSDYSYHHRRHNNEYLVPEDEIPKAKIVFNYIINNLLPFLNIIEKHRFLKIILKCMPNYRELFTLYLQKSPDNYIKPLFDKDIYVRKFDKFDNKMLNLFTDGIEFPTIAIDELLAYSQLIARKLTNQKMSGGSDIFFEKLEDNPENPYTPYFSDSLKLLNNIHYNIQIILKKLGYNKDDF